MSVELRSEHDEPIRPRTSDATIKALVRRLTDRDRHIMRLVWRHRVLTTNQLASLGWNSYNTAKQRLATLYELRALDRIRPFTAHGTSPWHYVLDTPGAEILAAEDGVTLRAFGYQRSQALAGATSSHLDHRLGINGVFVELYAHARHEAHDAHLHWQTESECADIWGDIVRPDGAGTWTVGNRGVRFFLEYDNGTERLARLRDKITAYRELATTAEEHGVVLFVLPSRKREAHLRRALGNDIPVPVATALHTDHPAEAVWTRVDDPHLWPRRLPDLVEQYEQPALFGQEEAHGQ